MLLLYLLAALDTDNGEFFRMLIDTHCNRLKAFAYGKIHNQEDAEEIVQDVFFKVYRYIEKFKGLPEDDVKKLLIAYTKTSLVDFYRRNKKSVKTVDGFYNDEGKEVEIPDITKSPETIVISDEACRTIADFIEKLPEAQRIVILLKYKFFHSDGEVAKILGISEQAVSSRANRARNSLKKMMEVNA